MVKYSSSPAMGAWPGRVDKATNSRTCAAEWFGGAPIPDLAAPDQCVHRTDDFRRRCFVVRLVEQIEIEVVGIEPPEAALGLLQEKVAREPRRGCGIAFVCGSVGRHDFCAEHDAVAVAPYRPAERHLGVAPAIGHRRVEEVDVLRQAVAQDLLTAWLVTDTREVAKGGTLAHARDVQVGAPETHPRRVLLGRR